MSTAFGVEPKPEAVQQAIDTADPEIAGYPKSRKIEGYFWPKAARLPSIGPVRVSFAQAREGTEA